MVTTIGRLDPIITWSHEVTWLIKNDISPLPRGTWLPNLTRWRFIVKSHYPLSLLTLWSRDQVTSYHATDEKRYISTSARPMATKLGRVVGSNASFLSIKPHNLLITWSHKVIWQMKNVLNSLSRDLSLSNLTEGWLMIRSHMSNHKATYSFDHVVTWAHATNELCYIFTCTRPIATKLNRMIAYNEEPPLIK